MSRCFRKETSTVTRRRLAGKGQLLRSGPRNGDGTNAMAETMPPWRVDIQPCGPGSNVPFNHETQMMKSMDNAGTAAAAGLVPGAWLCRPGDSKAVCGGVCSE